MKHDRIKKTVLNLLKVLVCMLGLTIAVFLMLAYTGLSEYVWGEDVSLRQRRNVAETNALLLKFGILIPIFLFNRLYVKLKARRAGESIRQYVLDKTPDSIRKRCEELIADDRALKLYLYTDGEEAGLSSDEISILLEIYGCSGKDEKCDEEETFSPLKWDKGSEERLKHKEVEENAGHISFVPREILAEAEETKKRIKNLKHNTPL